MAKTTMSAKTPSAKVAITLKDAPGGKVDIKIEGPPVPEDGSPSPAQAMAAEVSELLERLVGDLEPGGRDE